MAVPAVLLPPALSFREKPHHMLDIQSYNKIMGVAMLFSDQSYRPYYLHPP